MVSAPTFRARGTIVTEAIYNGDHMLHYNNLLEVQATLEANLQPISPTLSELALLTLGSLASGLLEAADTEVGKEVLNIGAFNERALSIIDLDTIAEGGYYQSVTPFTNSPTLHNYLVDHMESLGGTAMQKATLATGGASGIAYSVRRNRVAAAWTPWRAEEATRGPLANTKWVREFLDNPTKAAPTGGEWRQAFQDGATELRAGGTLLFNEPCKFDAMRVLVDGYVSIIGADAFYITHRFAKPEPLGGAVILGPDSGTLGTDDAGGGGGFLQANGLLTFMLDHTISEPDSGSRPRVHNVLYNFGVYGNGLTQGTGIRNFGNMYMNLRQLSVAFFPDWGIYGSGRPDIAPGSANGCRVEDIIVTSCGNAAAMDTSGGITWNIPDGYMGRIQSGGNIGRGMRVSGGQTAGDTIHIWNNSGKGLVLDGPNIEFQNTMIYETGECGLDLLASAENLTFRGKVLHSNQRGASSGVNSRGIFLSTGVGRVFLDVQEDGDFNIFNDYTTYAPWVTLTVYGALAEVVNDNKRYRTTLGGTSGAVPPTHTTGSVSDGGVTWTFVQGFTLVGLDITDATTPVWISELSSFTRNVSLDEVLTVSPHIRGAGITIREIPTSAAPQIIFDATTEGAEWELACRRISTNQDYVRAIILGGATPVIHNKTQNGTSIDLDVNAGNIRVTTTSGTAITAMCHFVRKK